MNLLGSMFMIPPDSGEKITLGVTILLAFFVNSLVVSNYTPEATNDLPVIGVYYIFNIIFVSLSLASTVGILNLHHRGCDKRKVPKFIKTVLFIRSNDSETSQKKKSVANKINVKEVEKKEISDSDYFLNLSKSFDLTQINQTNGNHLIELRDLRNNCEKYEKMESWFINQQNNKKFRKLCEKISKWSKQVETDRNQLKIAKQIITEWRQVARKLDRVLMIISALVIILAPIYLFGKYYFDQTNIDSSKNNKCSCPKIIS